MNSLYACVKEDGGYKALAVNLLLPVDQAVKAADGVALQPAHGTAAVKDEYQLGDVILHDESLLYCFFTLTV